MISRTILESMLDSKVSMDVKCIQLATLLAAYDNLKHALDTIVSMEGNMKSFLPATVTQVALIAPAVTLKNYVSTRKAELNPLIQEVKETAQKLSDSYAEYKRGLLLLETLSKMPLSLVSHLFESVGWFDFNSIQLNALGLYTIQFTHGTKSIEDLLPYVTHLHTALCESPVYTTQCF